MANLSARDTVKPTNSTNETTMGECEVVANDPRLSSSTRKRRRAEPSTTSTGIPQKAQRRDDQERDLDLDVENDNDHRHRSNVTLAFHVGSKEATLPRRIDIDEKKTTTKKSITTVDDITGDVKARDRAKGAKPPEPSETREPQDAQVVVRDPWVSNSKRKKHEHLQFASATHQDATPRKLALADCANRKDETTRLRKTIQWLEEGARRLREDLANVRTELHEERRAAKIVKREIEATIREARSSEAVKYQLIIADLKNRLFRPASVESTRASPLPFSTSLTTSSSSSTTTATASTTSSSSSSSPLPPLKVDLAKDENHRREISAMKKRLAESENTIRRLKWDALNLQMQKSTCRSDGTCCTEVRRLENDVHNLRANNEKLEAKLRIATDAEKARTAELRLQHENHEAELAAMRKSLRSETIKMMDELRAKSREIEKLSKLIQSENGSRKRRKPITKDDVTMRKLQESERNGPIRSAPRAEKKYLTDDHTLDSYIRDVGCDRAITEIEVERLRELTLEQQEVIEILRQTIKEKERKLEQLSNKKRKEEFYRQWLELEPVAEVDDEEDHEEGDSALSSAPSSLSPQPGGCGQWQASGVTREAYEAVLIEIEELQSKLLDERQELSHAKSQVRDLEKALLQETRCGGRTKQLDELNDKLRAAEEHEANLLMELSELREQNELLEFRLLELEESSTRRDSPDHTADSGIVSPELVHSVKEQSTKQRSRAVATVIPYTSNTTARPVTPPRKPPLSLQESGIFEDEEDNEDANELDQDEEESRDEEIDHAGSTTQAGQVEQSSRGTQTEEPSGELLQEVQRLQELRARIQERAAKGTSNVVVVHPTSDSRPFEADVVSVDSIEQLSSYQERIRELENRLERHDEAEEKRLQEKRLSKQREEDLLDENYKLTERVYWLENKLRNIEEMLENDVDQDRATSTRHDVDMEASGLPKATCCSEGVQTVEEELLDCPVTMPCPRCRTDDTSKLIDEESRWNTAETHRVMVEVVQSSKEVVEEVAKEAKEEEEREEKKKMPMTDEKEAEEEEGENEEEEKKTMDEVDGRKETSRMIVGRVSQVLVSQPEANQRPTEQERVVEPVVAFTESEKKVRQRQSKGKERDGRAMRSWNRSRAERVNRDTYYGRKSHRLVLYQEICV